jgi:hypothetical protein
MSQIFNSSSTIIKTKDLKTSQLAVILDYRWKGCVILRTYDQYVLVYSPNGENVACKCCWDSEPEFSVRLLVPGESVTLSND